jgi:NAD(P)-dependent dehydrogenase (short-subunit alcohol dehydrogenase family)
VDKTDRKDGSGTGTSREEAEKFLLHHLPMGKVVEPEDVADFVVFLASERAGMVSVALSM